MGRRVDETLGDKRRGIRGKGELSVVFREGEGGGVLTSCGGVFD